MQIFFRILFVALWLINGYEWSHFFSSGAESFLERLFFTFIFGMVMTLLPVFLLANFGVPITLLLVVIVLIVEIAVHQALIFFIKNRKRRAAA